jgi:hypothetical protein
MGKAGQLGDMTRYVVGQDDYPRCLAEFYIEILTSCVDTELVCFEACSQGVVGEGSKAEKRLQGQTAAARLVPMDRDGRGLLISILRDDRLDG